MYQEIPYLPGFIKWGGQLTLGIGEADGWSGYP